MTIEAHQQTLGFEAEVKQLLNLVIHSLYSNKEIFLRELVSNASDALDKLRFLALSNAPLYENDSDLKIEVTLDEKRKTITILDNGVGMTREEVIENLGTIAKSGTKEFLTQLTGEAASDSNLIGQFGVGFYSSFIVADAVTVKSRKAGLSSDLGVLWQSEGDGSFKVETIEKSTRGTEVTLHLKKEAHDFLSAWRLKNIITKYSDHICWPIVMQKQAPIEEGEEGKEGIDAKSAKKQEVPTLETVNKATALWTLSKSEIKDEDYDTLYKHISHDFENPLAYVHNQVEGKQEYVTLLYIPKHAPFDLWNAEKRHGLKLYVKRVFIMDDADQFLPRYLRFVKGIVDANDLPLNVSREILQDNKLIDAIKTASVKRILSLLEKMSVDDVEKYNTFWDEFGQVLKEGGIEDFANKDKIARLLRFSSTYDDNAVPRISLEAYVSRMKEGQDQIYYLTASAFNAAKDSPHLELFRKKGIEVLILTDRVDEWLVSYLTEFDGKKLHSVAKGALDLGTLEDVEETKTTEAQFRSLIEHVKEVLGDKVKEVRLSHRLTDSPVCIVADEHEPGLEMRRILQASGQKMGEFKPIFELNPKHVLIEKLHAETDDVRFSEWTTLFFEQALLAEGGTLDNPALFVGRINKLLLSAFAESSVGK